ncbi:hypothetical protein T439DRAFT_323147 [Meredithblackwellia eburnea MCA 4105]
MRSTILTTILTITITLSITSAQTTSGGTDDPDAVWYQTGSDSPYWHQRYHAILAMSLYGDYNTTCPQTFTNETLQQQYPGNTNVPFLVVGTWGPTPKYRSEGIMVRVPEMNKILMVFKGIYGWENFNATLVPFTGIGCDATCKVHAGALEAWEEVKAETNDMEAIKDNQGSLVWSASGHGFGASIAMVGALDLKYRTLLYSCMTFGAPAVFNNASVALWDSLFYEDGSQHIVANNDIVPTIIPVTNGSSYTFPNTRTHVFGTSSMYGQDYNICVDSPLDPDCLGGTSYDDHWFYYTDAGFCGNGGWSASYNTTFNAMYQRQVAAAYNATATAPLLTSPVTTFAPAPLTTSTPVTTTTTSSPAITTAADNRGAVTSSQAAASATTKVSSSARARARIGMGVVVGAVVGLGFLVVL